MMKSIIIRMTAGPWKAAEKSACHGKGQPESITVFSVSDAEVAPLRVYGDTPEQRKANAAAAEKLPALVNFIFAYREARESGDYTALDELSTELLAAFGQE